MLKENRKNADQFQQGDVWLERVNAIPADAAAAHLDGAVVAEGEGHHLHRFAVGDDVELYLHNGIRFARLKRPATLEHVTLDGRHGEHHPLILPAGDYKFGQVVEYDYLTGMAQPVID